MSYVIGWGAVALLAGGVALLLRKVGAPGGKTGAPPPGDRPCCNNPPEVPGARPVRRRVGR